MKNYCAILVCFLFLVGCDPLNGIGPDERGDTPRDVLDRFVELCKQGEYLEAKKMWTTKSIEEISRVYESGGFSEMCNEISGIELRYGSARHGKMEYVIHIKAVDESGKLKKHFYFIEENGVWKLIWPTAYE